MVLLTSPALVVHRSSLPVLVSPYWPCWEQNAPGCTPCAVGDGLGDGLGLGLFVVGGGVGFLVVGFGFGDVVTLGATVGVGAAIGVAVGAGGDASTDDGDGEMGVDDARGADVDSEPLAAAGFDGGGAKTPTRTTKRMNRPMGVPNASQSLVRRERLCIGEGYELFYTRAMRRTVCETNRILTEQALSRARWARRRRLSTTTSIDMCVVPGLVVRCAARQVLAGCADFA